MKSLIHQELSFGGTEGIVEEYGDVDRNTANTFHEKESAQRVASFLFDDFSDEEGSVVYKEQGSATIDDVDAIEEFASFEVGDHVYMWSKMRQLHGIVLQIDGDGTALIADFSVPPLGSNESSSSEQSDSHGDSMLEVVSFQFRREHAERTKWRKVQYGVKKWERAVRPPGTCTCETASTSQTVLDRLNFLMLHYHLVPRPHAVISNSETLASWCMLGKWRALQMNQILDISNTASVVGTGSLATYAAAESAGLCCLLGAELAISAPLLLPAIAVGSIAAGGATVWNTHRMRREWKDITQRLNQEFDRFQLLHEEGLAQPASGEEIDAELQFHDIMSSQSTTLTSISKNEPFFQKSLSFLGIQRSKSAQLAIV